MPRSPCPPAIAGASSGSAVTPARPPLGNDRLEEQPDGRLTLRLETRWRDGTTHVLLERSDLLDRLVPLIPPAPHSPGAVLRNPGTLCQPAQPGRARHSARKRTRRSRSRSDCARHRRGRKQRTGSRHRRWPRAPPNRSARSPAGDRPPTPRLDGPDGLRSSSASSTSAPCVALAAARRFGSSPRSRTPRSSGGFSIASAFRLERLRPRRLPRAEAPSTALPALSRTRTSIRRRPTRSPEPTASCLLPRLRPDGHTPARGPRRSRSLQPGTPSVPAPRPHCTLKSPRPRAPEGILHNGPYRT
jgi:hypothetical protein